VISTRRIGMKLVIKFAIVAVCLVGISAHAAGQKKRKNTWAPKQEKKVVEETSHKMAGCGLGSMVVEDSSKWSQVLAATLNGTGMQTFGISFGTSNCTEDGVMQASKEKEAFIEANVVELRRDLALGQGEYLSALGSLYGCSGEANQGFMKTISLKQQSIFQQNQSTEESLRVMDNTLLANPILASSCQG